VVTDAVGRVEIEVPRDRYGTFDPVIVRKRQRRLSDVDTVVVLLYAKGLTTGEISAHLAGVYGVGVSKDTVSRITDAPGVGHVVVQGSHPDRFLRTVGSLTAFQPPESRGLLRGVAVPGMW
jgi:hypothetical protein